MKLWLLRPREDIAKSAFGPWAIWWDKAFGFVVRAETEEQARQIANANAGDENGDEHPWLGFLWSTCEELSAEGTEGVIIQDFARA